MEYRPKSTFEIRTNKRNNNYNYLNFYNSNGINQSPKISSNKIRNILDEKKLFSLVDINEKITNSKGTSFPNQYKRLSQDEINKQFGMDKLEGWNYNRLLINKYVKRIQTSKSSFNSKNSLDGNELPSIEKKKSKIKSISQPKQVSDNKDNFLNLENQNNKNLIKNDINSKTSVNILNNSINDENKINNNNLNSIKKTKNDNKVQYIYPTNKRNDRWMPKNYQNYELLVKNPNILYHKLKEDSIKRKIPFFNSKEISKKMNDTDVFFVKNKTIVKNILTQKKYSSSIYTDSDIYCNKNDIPNLSKCGETYLFKSNPKNKYTTVNESNSKWEPSSNLPNLINYPSIEYNILCPDKKNYNKTRKNIIEECKNKTKNNNNNDDKNNNIYFNPTHKQKGLAEFIDITQNGSGNPGREFVKTFKDNPFCCQKNSDVCATFGDIHMDYNSTCTRPFIKERF